MSGLRMHTGVVKIHTNPSCELRIFANVNLANKSVLRVYLENRLFSRSNIFKSVIVDGAERLIKA